MRVLLPLAMSLWFIGLFGAPPIAPAQEAPTPHFQGQRLPKPPQQEASWTPAKDDQVPENWIWATRILFSQGVADPRGCEYRQIEIVVGSVSGGGYPLPTRGWVFPRDKAGTQDFAVCWNGLVYPVIKVGEPADFRDDALGFKEDAQKSRFLSRGEAVMVRGVMAANTGPNNFPFKACMLLRLGEPALAHKAVAEEAQILRKRWADAGVPATAKPLVDSTQDPYLEWARQWAWAMWDRAICAHLRGDDRLALADLLTLRTVWAEIDREAKLHGFQLPRKADFFRDKTPTSYLPWLESNFDILLADQQRRSTLPAHRTALQKGLDTFPDSATRIRALVDDLPEIAVRQWAQPGNLNSYTTDPIFNALVKTGEAAIEPLLQAWEERGSHLTRSVSYGRDFASGRTFHPIAEPISEALAEIMQAPADAFQTLPGGMTPATVREYWKENRGITPAERCYRTLADDQAGVAAWLLAAGEIMRPSNQRRQTGRSYRINALKPGESAPFVGEELRKKTNPTLAEVWARRVPQVFPEKLATVTDMEALFNACRFVRQLARWDPPAALPSVRLALEVCYRVANEAPSLSRHGRLFLCRFTIQLHENGDPDALARYCAWLGEARNEEDGQPFYPEAWRSTLHTSINMQLFSPLWKNSDDPKVLATIHRLFVGPDAPMAAFLSDASRQENLLFELIGTPMLRFAEIRPYVLNALNDRSEMGEVSVNAQGNRLTKSTPFKGPPPLSGTPLNTKLKYRACDYWTWRLSLWKGMPEMDLTWPEDRRDAARAAATRLLQAPKGLFLENEPSPLPGAPPRFWLLEE